MSAILYENMTNKLMMMMVAINHSQ